MSARLSRCVAVYSRHFVASRINAPAIVVAVVFTLDHFVTTQRTMGWTKSALDPINRYLPPAPELRAVPRWEPRSEAQNRLVWRLIILTYTIRCVYVVGRSFASYETAIRDVFRKYNIDIDRGLVIRFRWKRTVLLGAYFSVYSLLCPSPLSIRAFIIVNHVIKLSNIFSGRRYTSAVLAMAASVCLCLTVRLPHVRVLLKQMAQGLSSIYSILCCKKIEVFTK